MIVESHIVKKWKQMASREQLLIDKKQKKTIKPTITPVFNKTQKSTQVLPNIFGRSVNDEFKVYQKTQKTDKLHLDKMTVYWHCTQYETGFNLTGGRWVLKQKELGVRMGEQVVPYHKSKLKRYIDAKRRKFGIGQWRFDQSSGMKTD